MIAAARYGGKRADGAYSRVFGKYVNRPTGASEDDWQLPHLRFRADRETADIDTLSFQGYVYHGDIGQLAPSITVIGRPEPARRLRVNVSGGNIRGRWRQRIGEAADFHFRAYYDRTHRNDPAVRDDLDTVDLAELTATIADVIGILAQS